MKSIRGGMTTMCLLGALFVLSFALSSEAKTTAVSPEGPLTSHLITISTGTYPPWTGKELHGGGFINEIVSEAFAQEGYRVQFRYLPWKRAYAEVKAGKVPASSYWYYQKNRDQYFFQSEPVYTETIYFMYNRVHPLESWKTLDDLKGFVIGATDGFTYTKAFWDKIKDKSLTVQLTTSDLLNIRKLLKRRVDLVPLERNVAYYLIRKHFNANDINSIGYNPKPLAVESDRVLFSRKYPGAKRLLAIFNNGLAKLKKQGRIVKLKRDLSKGMFDQ